jgi:hypothetical protein
MTTPPTTSNDLRKFGLLVGGIFCVIGVWPALYRGQPLRAWALIVGILLIVPALIIPRALGPVYRVWMLVGETLGWINSRILLTVLFYVVLTPMGSIMRMLGKNTMRRAFDPSVESYRVPKEPRAGAHMTRQF